MHCLHNTAEYVLENNISFLSSPKKGHDSEAGYYSPHPCTAPSTPTSNYAMTRAAEEVASPWVVPSALH